ncbi:MAG: SusF/SusE family outer membrane protein [Bacteroidaceae bacterium]|nr:SusF/SusE family outer membrane protein [Bacteroidaceae bacterium]
MKHFSRGCLLFALCLLSASCEKDNDSNPNLNTENLQMTLLESEYPTSLVVDLSQSETVNLKVQEQPNYGYPAVTIYSVQVSIDSTFMDVSPSEADPGVKYVTLSTTYTSASMNVDAMEMNNAIIKMYQSAHNGADPTGQNLTAYIRVKAEVYRTQGTECYSNVIRMSNLIVAYVAAVPKTIFLSGTSVKGGNGSKEWAPVYGAPGNFYTMAYFGAGDTFLWGDSEETGSGYSRTSSIDDQAGAGITEAEDGSIKVGNAGWYVLQMATVVDKAKNALVSDLTVYPGHAYIIGATTGNWDDSDAASEMTAPAAADGIWESPAFTAGGELRAYIKVPGLDWWKTEFTLYKGSLYWRVVDIPSNWNDNVGSAYSVTCSEGQKLYVNFDDLTGEVK